MPVPVPVPLPVAVPVAAAQQRQHQQATRPAIAGAGHRLHSITPPGRPWPPATAPGQHHTAPA
ncbi:hypothetical protein [Limnohabitans sp. WS1]|uniref:hypothetical protein n=1 Tax=Limnohabitans sp. WS1 TaxID=1100726 RepID=UPI001304A47F|nr:hypothetical protein [Limnohabitans sp. WS1]